MAKGFFMSWITILLLASAVVLIVGLVLIIIAQIRSSRHIETLKKKTEAPKEEEPKARPKVSHGAQPAPRRKPAAKESAVKPKPAAPAETPAEPQKPEVRTRPEKRPEPEVPAKSFEPKPYPEYDNTRAMEQLGLSQEEADMFISELVVQIEEELPNLDAAYEQNDLERLEKVSHMLKGSATSLGEGGVADILVELNTYCKSGKDRGVIGEHLKNLHYYFGKLKEKFGG